MSLFAVAKAIALGIKEDVDRVPPSKTPPFTIVKSLDITLPAIGKPIGNELTDTPNARPLYGMMGISPEAEKDSVEFVATLLAFAFGTASNGIEGYNAHFESGGDYPANSIALRLNKGNINQIPSQAAALNIDRLKALMLDGWKQPKGEGWAYKEVDDKEATTLLALMAPYCKAMDMYEEHPSFSSMVTYVPDDPDDRRGTLYMNPDILRELREYEQLVDTKASAR